MEAVVIDGNTWYQKTFKDVDVALGGIKFKLKSQDQSKGSNELQTTEDKCYDARVITAITETTCGQLPTGETPKVTYNVEVPAGTNTCYIAGEMNGWTLTEMTKVDDIHYTITIEGATTAHKYKYASGPDWGYVEQTAEGGNVADRTWAENDVVAKWTSVYNPSAPTYDYYLTGSLVGGWDVKQQGIEKDGELYKATFTELNAGIYEFKITAGDWDHQWNYYNLGAAYKEVSEGTGEDGKPNGNIKIDTDEAINLTVIFDATAGEITFEGLNEKVVTYQLKGVGGWDQPGIELVQNPDPEKASEYMLTCQAISATDAIKVVRLEDGEIKDYYGNGTVKDDVEVTVEYDDQANIKLPAGTYNFYFDTAESEKKLWIEAATDCEPTPDYTRTVGNNQFGTICLPFGGTITGAVLYECVGSETGKVYLGSVTTLAAGVPYIFQATATELAVYSDGTAATAGSHNGLHGTFTDDTEVAVGNYILKDNALCQAAATCYVNANRAYLVMSEVPTGVPTQMPGRRYIGMDVQGENEATGVEDIFSTDAPVKVIENGQLIIIRDGVKYNVQGQVIK